MGWGRSSTVLIRSIESLTLRWRKLLRGCMRRVVWSILAMLLLLLREELLGLLERLRSALLVWYRGHRSGNTLCRRRWNIGLLVRGRARLGLVRTILSLGLGLRWWRRLGDRRRRLVVLLLLVSRLTLLLLLLLLPICAVAIIRIQLGLISGARGSSSLLSCL